jgi:ABC-type nitrate/sulfonate/bicarbonate transport system substrate-binding protein
MTPIRIGIAHWGAGLAPVFAAVEAGTFADEQLEAELVFVPGHDRALAALVAGEVEFINSVGPEVLLANAARGGRGEAVIVASAISRSAVQVAARPGITTRDELRGARWGVTARNDPDEVSIRQAFERWGWDVDRDAEIVVVGRNQPRLDALLDTSRVDAAMMHAPEPFQAESRGWRIVDDLGRLDAPIQNSCAVTTRRMLADRPDTVLRYVRAYAAAVWRFRTDARFGVDVLAKYTREPDHEVLRKSWLMFARLMGGMLFPSVEGVREAGRIMHELGVLSARPNPYDHLDLGPVASLEGEGAFARIMGLAA